MLGQQALLTLLVDALEASNPPFDGGVGRQRVRALPEAFTQAVNVRVVRADPESLAGQAAPVDYVTRVGLDCIGKVTATAAPDEAAGEVLTLAHSCLVAASGDLVAQGFEIDPAPTLMWDQEELDERIGVVTAVYNFRHRVSPLTLSA